MKMICLSQDRFHSSSSQQYTHAMQLERQQLYSLESGLRRGWSRWPRACVWRCARELCPAVWAEYNLAVRWQPHPRCSTRAHAREHIQLRLSITERWRNTRAGAHTDIGPMDTRHDTRKKSNSTKKDMTTHRCEDGAARLHQFLPLAGPRCPDHPSPLPTCVLSLACCYDENTHKNVGFTRCFLITAGTSLSGQRLPALMQDRRNQDESALAFGCLGRARTLLSATAAAGASIFASRILSLGDLSRPPSLAVHLPTHILLRELPLDMLLPSEAVLEVSFRDKISSSN
jgi:hypothetical protein